MAKEKTGRVPMYQTVIDALTARIQSGAFSFDEPLCTEAALMEQHDVSRITARRALEELEDRGLIYRKRGIGCFVSREAYEKLNRTATDPDAHAEQNGALYALVFPDALEHGQIQAVFDGASEFLAEHGCWAAAYLTGDTADSRPGAILDKLSSMRIAGAALLTGAPSACQPELNRLLIQNKAVVLADCASPYPHVSSVSFDEIDAAHQLVEHLTALGHARIAYYAASPSEPSSASGRRLAGILMALAQYGIEISPDLICSADDPRALRRCIRSGITAIIAENAELMQRVARDCTAIGVYIPGSLSLCCMESSKPLPPLRQREAPISVTSIERDYFTLGRSVAQRLLDVSSHPIQPAQNLALPVKLLPGDSTASPRKA